MFAARSWFTLKLDDLFASSSGSVWVMRVLGVVLAVVVRTVNGVGDMCSCAVNTVTE